MRPSERIYEIFGIHRKVGLSDYPDLFSAILKYLDEEWGKLPALPNKED